MGRNSGLPSNFTSEVFPAELEEIRARLEAEDPSGESRKTLPEGEGEAPSTELELVGLAFSGGGIRSAVFNLGVLQGLFRMGVFRHVDYMSTVSGGGFLGSSLSSLMQKAEQPFPFAHLDRQGEVEPMTHLRLHSDYLTPGGAMDYLRLAAVLFRGLFLNFLIVLPALLAVAALVDWRYGKVLRLGARGAPQWDFFLTFTPLVLLGVLLTWTLSPLVTHWYLQHGQRRTQTDGALRGDERLSRRQRFEWFFAWLGVLVLGGLLLDLLPVLVHYFHMARSQGLSWDALMAVVSSLSAVASFTAGRQGAGGGVFGAVLAKVRIYLVGLFGPLIPVVLFFYLTEWLVYQQHPEAPYTPAMLVAIAAGIALYTWIFVDVNEHSAHSFWRDRLSESFLIGEDRDGQLGPEDDLPLTHLREPGSRAPYHLLNTSLNLQANRDFAHSGRYSDFFVFSKRYIGSKTTGWVETGKVEAVEPHVDLGTAMAISSAAAAPNMGSFTNPALTFLMALLNVRMGWWAPNPARLRAGDKRNGKRYRAGPAHLVREMLGRLHADGRLVNLSDGGHLENLGVYELLRRRCKYIIVGDGEADPGMNFGAMASLIRFARIDLGVEIEIDLSDLHPVVPGQAGRQHCALGRIHYPASDTHQAEVGRLLYIKSSITGDEDGLIAEYKAKSPSFPHETTADQSFDERQFEAYRSLGYHIVMTMLTEALPKREVDAEGAAPLNFIELTQLFERLAVQLAPRLAAGEQTFLALQQQLGELEVRLGGSQLEPYYQEIYPELGAPDPETSLQRLEQSASYRGLILEAVNAQMQLMENVFLGLDLDQARRRRHPGNAGWMQLFRRWARSPSFSWGYGVSMHTFGRSFRLFCDESLGMGLAVWWDEVDTDTLITNGLIDGKTADRLATEIEKLQAQGEQTHVVLGRLMLRGTQVRPEIYVGWANLHGDLRESGFQIASHDLFGDFREPDFYALVLQQLARYDREVLRAHQEAPRWQPQLDDLLPAYREQVDIVQVQRNAYTVAPIKLRDVDGEAEERWPGPATPG